MDPATSKTPGKMSTTNSEGKFSVDLEIPYGTSLGYHNLTAESLGNNYYIGNSTTSKLFWFFHLLISLSFVLIATHLVKKSFILFILNLYI